MDSKAFSRNCCVARMFPREVVEVLSALNGPTDWIVYKHTFFRCRLLVCLSCTSDTDMCFMYVYLHVLQVHVHILYIYINEGIRKASNVLIIMYYDLCSHVVALLLMTSGASHAHL